MHVQLKKQGMMDADYDVIDLNTGQTWMLIDTVGGMFTKGIDYYVKYRAQGQEESTILGAASIKNEVDFDGKITDVDRDVDIEWDSDPDDFSSDSESGDSDGDSVLEVKIKTKVKGKWKMKQKAKFFNDKEHTQPIGELQVKSKGKCKAKHKTVINYVEDHDEEGNVTGTHEEHEEQHHHKVKLKDFKYKFEVYGAPILLMVDKDKKHHGTMFGGAMKWVALKPDQTPLFEVKGDGRNCEIKTFDAEPASTLLAAFAAACQFDPQEVQDHATSHCRGFF
jgi:hypothetical protein